MILCYEINRIADSSVFFLFDTSGPPHPLCSQSAIDPVLQHTIATNRGPLPSGDPVIKFGQIHFEVVSVPCSVEVFSSGQIRAQIHRTSGESVSLCFLQQVSRALPKNVLIQFRACKMCTNKICPSRLSLSQCLRSEEGTANNNLSAAGAVNALISGQVWRVGIL